MAQAGYSTETLEDVAVRIQRATIDRSTGIYTPVGEMIEFVADTFERESPNEMIRVDPGQSYKVQKLAVKSDERITINFKSGISDYEVNNIQYEVEIAGDSLWRTWLVYMFDGGSWGTFYMQLASRSFKKDNPCTATLTFEQGPQPPEA